MQTRLSIVLFSITLLAWAGCKPFSRVSDDDRFRGSLPTSRSREKDRLPPPQPVAIKPIEKPSEPLLLAPPQPDERIVPVDFQKPSSLPSVNDSEPTPPGIIPRIRERRDERRNPTPPDNKPELPSPFEKDRKEGPSAGGDFPTPMQPKTVTPPATIPATTAKPATDLDKIKQVYQLCKTKWDGIKDYEAVLIRREVIGGKESPTEEMIFRFRKEPFSVYTKNIGAAGKGREILYVAGSNAKMHILTGEGDNRLVGAGFYSQLSPDDRMVTSKSRHKITEGAVGRTIEMLGKAIVKVEKGEFNGLKSMGLVKRKEYADTVEGIEATLPAGSDPELPKGGKREVYFDANPQSPSYGLPVLIRLLEGERELEYYSFSKFKIPGNFNDGDFDPAKFGKKK